MCALGGLGNSRVTRGLPLSYVPAKRMLVCWDCAVVLSAKMGVARDEFARWHRG
jgi:hypothetical protein